MKKLSLISGVLIFLAVSTVNAQNFDFKAPSAANGPGGPSNQVMSTSDFQSMVNQLGQQNLNNLSQQVKQQQAKPLPPPGNTSIPPPPPSENTIATSPTAPPPVTLSPPATSPQQSQVYTGFGNTTNTGTTPNPSNNNNSGGWNIKY